MTDENDYTRVKFNVQTGDGPDARGDVSVELSRSHDEASPEEVRREAQSEIRQAVDHLETLLFPQ